MNEQAAIDANHARNAPAPAPGFPVVRVLAIAAAAVALLVGLYWALGTYYAPRLIEREAKAWVTTNLKQDLAIGAVRVDPFGFKVDIEGIALPAQAPMVAAQALHIDFDARSLFGESWRFDTIRITAPSVNAIVEPNGKLNLLRLVPPPNPDPFPPVLIADLVVEQGRALLADHSKPNRPDTLLAPIAFRLENLHTTRDEGGGFRLAATSDAGEQFVFKGEAAMAPIGSHGGIAVRGLKAASVHEFLGDRLPADLRDGQIDFDLAYAASYGDAGARLKAELPRLDFSGLKVGGRPELFHADFTTGRLSVAGIAAEASLPPEGQMQSAVRVGSVTLADLAVTGTGPARGEGLRLASATVDGIGLAPEAGSFTIERVRLAGLDAGTTRLPDGSIGLLRLVPASRGARKGAAAMGMPAIGELSLTDTRLTLLDQAVKPATRWTIAPLSVSARSPGGSAPLKLVVEGRVNGATRFAVDGTVDPAGPAADMSVRLVGFPVKAAVPYTVDFPRLEIVSGTASAGGRLRYGPKGTGYAGTAAIDDLKLIETYQNTDLVSWKRLELNGIDATPARASIETVRVTRPYGTVIILSDGTLNFQRLVTFNPQPVVTPAADAAPPPKLTRAERRAQAKQVEAEKQVTAAQARAALAAPIVEPTFPIRVKRVEVAGGTMDFADYSLRPNFAAKVEGINGALANLTNSPRGLATVKLDGFVIDKFSPVTIKGELTPLQFDRRTKIDMAFRNIELPVFNPYSGRWAGYSIAKGKLTTELGYTIDNRALDAKHHIVIDQLEWGEPTDSKEKVSMPIKFATSLLKDKNGVIELDVPVTGTLDDPEFSLGPIIWKVIGNLMEKVLTAPFRALGDLFGGKEDVQFVDFAPGSAVVPSEATSNLAGIAKGLGEKPELRLDIPSGPGLPLDAVGLADRKIAAAAMAKEAKKGETPDLAALELSKRHDRLEDLYKARFKTSPKYPAPETKDEGDARRQREIDWLTAELRKSFAPTPEELATLGKARAEAVRLALLEGATPVDPARVFLSGRESAAEKDGKARMELKLEGS